MRTILTAIAVGVLVVASSAAYAGVAADAQCKEKKAKATGKKAADLLKALGKNVKKTDAAKLAQNISKAQSKFTKAFGKAEEKGGCDTTGDAAAIEAKVDAFVADTYGMTIDPCCYSNPGALAFGTIDVGVKPKCGEMRNFRCSVPGKCSDTQLPCVLEADCPGAGTCEGEGSTVFISHMCTEGNDSQCDFGPCTPPSCQGDPAITCTEDKDCAATCNERTSEGFPINLLCGGLYTGGGLNSVPLPLQIPDKGVTVHTVTGCSDGVLTLGPAAQDEIGDNYGIDGQGMNCTQGKKCKTDISPNPGGLDGNGLCRIEDDCGCVFGDGCCEERCLFGPPLPIPNTVSPPTSVCVRNVITRDTSGTVDCYDGSSDVSIPIASVIHVTGDLLNKSSPPDVPGLQTCPLCSKVCVGGSNVGFPCVDNSDCDSNTCSGSEQCLAGPRDGLPCTPHTSKLDVHNCCANGARNLQRCSDQFGFPNNAYCAPPPGPAPRCELSFDPCTDDSDCTALPNDACVRCVPGCTSFPTSHDCPPDPGQDITFRIGGLPIDFKLTDKRDSMQAIDLSTDGRRVFCGYCRDVNGVGSLKFEGDPDPTAPPANPPAEGYGVPCASDADCAADRCLDGINKYVICTDDSDCPGSTCVGGLDEYETCSQRDPGAFSKAAATYFWSAGVPSEQSLSDYECHDSTLVGLFCIQPTFDATIDNAGDLPGPAVSNLIGKTRLGSTPDELFPLDGDICYYPSGAFVEPEANTW